jgi:hypothetical protein
MAAMSCSALVAPANKSTTKQGPIETLDGSYACKVSVTKNTLLQTANDANIIVNPTMFAGNFEVSLSENSSDAKGAILLKFGIADSYPKLKTDHKLVGTSMFSDDGFSGTLIDGSSKIVTLAGVLNFDEISQNRWQASELLPTEMIKDIVFSLDIEKNSDSDKAFKGKAECHWPDAGWGGSVKKTPYVDSEGSGDAIIE